MSSTLSAPEAPYYAVIQTSQLLSDDVLYRVMIEKLLLLAQEQSGFIEGSWTSGETDVFITYWQTKDQAQAWLAHPMQTQTCLIGERLWYQSYSKRLVEVTAQKYYAQEHLVSNPSRFPSINTPRGVLTILEESQAGLLYDYVNEERSFLKPWEPKRSDAYYSMETCELRVREMRRDFIEEKAVVFCLLNQDQTRMLAYSNYSNLIKGVLCSCSLGYSIREAEQGKGLMREALENGIEYLHKHMGIDRIQANYMPRNKKSASVLHGLKFTEEGYAKRFLKIDGVWEDHVLTALVLR
ncbi:GNAT family N-acetyltransferase [Marinomonas epiphytica]